MRSKSDFSLSKDQTNRFNLNRSLERLEGTHNEENEK